MDSPEVNIPTPGEIRAILGMRSAEERSRAIFGQDVMLCTAPDLLPGEPECRRLAMWKWQPDDTDHPVFLCNFHAEPLDPATTALPAPVEHMPIGYDIDLLCDAVTWAVERRSRVLVHAANVQRHVRVGFAKAGRLLLLMDSYGITEGHPTRTVRVTKEQLPTVLAKLRDLASKEASGA